MDYTGIMDELKKADSFDLYRLYVAIGNEMMQPKHLETVKRSLRVGDIVSYLDDVTNSLIECRVRGIRKTTVEVQHISDGTIMLIKPYMINLKNSDIGICRTSQKTGMERNQLAVGDMVGFIDRDNIERYGKVVRLNHKTVTLKTKEGYGWRVSYGFLFPVVDGIGNDCLDVFIDREGIKIIEHSVD